jgi:hypothetical protein
MGSSWATKRVSRYPRPDTSKRTATRVEPGLCGYVLNPLLYSESRGRWIVRRKPPRWGRGRRRFDSNGIPESHAEENGETHAVGFVAFDGDELGDASSLCPIPVVMLDDPSSELDSSEDATAVRLPLGGRKHEGEERPLQC